jgi:hypothetical protein
LGIDAVIAGPLWGECTAGDKGDDRREFLLRGKKAWQAPESAA